MSLRNERGLINFSPVGWAEERPSGSFSSGEGGRRGWDSTGQDQTATSSLLVEWKEMEKKKWKNVS